MQEKECLAFMPTLFHQKLFFSTCKIHHYVNKYGEKYIISLIVFFQSYYVFQVLNIFLYDSKITSNVNLLYT